MNLTSMKHVWLSDCNSLVSHLHNACDARLENTRLSIDISALRQRLWLDPDGEPYEELPHPKEAANVLRWIDTSAMCVDCLTKKMKAGCLWDVMHGHVDINATPESIITKMRKSKLRRKTTDEDGDADEVQT